MHHASGLRNVRNDAPPPSPLTHYHTIPHIDALKIYSVENIVGKGEIACNKQFLLLIAMFSTLCGTYFFILNALQNVVCNLFEFGPV